jgi:hypothetical protein
MKIYKNVRYTKPIELIFLLISTMAILFGILILSDKTMSVTIVHVLVALIVAGIYFIMLKKKYIVKTVDFKLSTDRLEWNTNRIEFRNIDSYKIHWMKGAGIKFKLKNGEVKRLSANSNFCNAEKFVALCQEMDSKLSKFNNNQITRKASFYETKQGFYFAATMTVLLFIGFIVKMFRDDDFSAGNILLVTVLLGAMWSGVRYVKKKSREIDS